MDQDACPLRTGAETVEILAVHLGMLGADLEEVTHVPELDRPCRSDAAYRGSVARGEVET